MSVRWRIVGWFVVPTIAVLSIVAIVNFFAYQSVTEELVDERNRDLIRLSANQLSNSFKDYEERLQTVIRDGGLSSGGNQMTSGVLAENAGPLAVFDGGTLLLSRTGEIVGEYPPGPNLIGSQWPNRDHMAALFRSGRPLYSDVLPGITGGGTSVAVLVPIIRPGGSLGGAAVGIFDLGQPSISTFYGGIVRLRLQRSGSVYMVDSVGRVIYDSDGNFVGTDTGSHGPVQQVLAGASNSLRTTGLDGTDVVAAFAPVPGTEWGLVSEERWSDLSGDSATFQRLLLALMIVGVVLPAGIVTIGLRRLLRPISELNAAANAVGGGEYGRQVSVKSSDEFGQLGSAFNHMSLELKRSYVELEDRVEERTSELRRAELLNTSLIDNSPDGIVFEKNNRFFRFNRAACEIFGLSAEDLANQSVEAWFKNEDFTRLQELRSRLKNPGDHIENFEVGITRGDGSHAILSMTGRRQTEEEGLAVEMIMRDVTSRHDTEEELFEQTRELAVLDERNRIAYEIHDTIAQGLTGVILQLEAAGDFTEGVQPELAEHMTRAQSLARESLTEARRSVWNLSPGALESSTLQQALQQEVEKFDLRGNATASFSVEGEAPQMSKETESALLRICQEALMNVRKYARATKVDVQLRFEPDQFTLRVADDGQGFDIASVQTSEHGGFGLANMRRRAQIEGGTFSVESAHGEGTTIHVTVPV